MRETVKHKKYNHAFMLHFAVESDEADGSKVTQRAMEDALKRRVKYVMQTNSIKRAAAPAYHTVER